MASPPEMIPGEMLEFKVIWRREDEEEIYGRTNNQDIKRNRIDGKYTGDLPSAQCNIANILPVAKQIWWNGRIGGKAAEGAGKREFRFKETGVRVIAGYSLIKP